MKYMFSTLALLVIAAVFFTACPAGDTDNPATGTKTWTVTFDVGYTGGTSPASITVADGDAAVDAFPDDPVRAEYLFSGWFEGSDKYTKYRVIRKNVNLIAQWMPQYTISFNIGYTEGTAPEPIVLIPGQSGGILFPPDPTRYDWLFKGWFDEDNLKYTRDTVATKSVTVTAQWFQGYRVTLAVSGGMSQMDPPYIDVERNQAMGDQFPPDAVLPEKFDFDGWYSSANVKYDNTTVISGDITLTGRWTKAADVMRITARNSGNPVFKFTLSSGDTFGDYTKITVKFLVNDENQSTTDPVIRLYGNYIASDFTTVSGRQSINLGGNRGGISYNSGFMQMNITVPIPVKYQWYTQELQFADVLAAAASTFPAATETDDFYFALGLGLGGGTGSATHVTSYMTEVTLSNADGSKKVVSTGSGHTPNAAIHNSGAAGDITVQ